MDQQQKPSDPNKKYAYIAIGVVAVLLLGYGIYSYNHDNWNIGLGNKEQDQDYLDNVAPDATTTEPSTGTTGGTKKLAYGDAIKAYPYRFQFSKCLGTPATLAVKTGSYVMLDNRDSVAHTIVADKQTFKIAGFDYALVHTSTLGNLSVLCDGKPRVTLNVQK